MKEKELISNEKKSNLESNNSIKSGVVKDSFDSEKEKIVNQEKYSSKIIKGNLDDCDEHGIRGWIVDKDNPNQPVEIEILIDKALIAQTKANVFRKDLMIFNNGQCAFHIPIPNKFFDGQEHEIEIIESKNQLILENFSKKFTLPINEDTTSFFEYDNNIQGSVESFLDCYFSGWITQKNKVFSNIEIIADNFLVHTENATNFREDLFEKNINDGYAAFNIKIPASLRDKGNVNIRIESNGYQLHESIHRFSPLKALIISETDNLEDASRYYRCEHLRLLLKKDGIDAQVIGAYEFNTREYPAIDIMIFCRFQADNVIFSKIQRYKIEYKTKIIYETDDLIFLPWHTHDLGSVRSGVDRSDDPNLIAMFARRLKLLLLADSAITTTNKIKTYLDEMGLPTIMLPNMIRNHDISHRCYEKKPILNILCMAGSPTHYRDFQEIEVVLEKFLLRHSQTVVLTLLGRFRDDLKLLALPNVKHLHRVSYQNMLQLISKHDLCLVPLEYTDFNNAKSCLKYIECGAKGVPIIASATQDYKRVIKNGVNGFLATNSFSWLELLEHAVKEPLTIFNVGIMAQKDVENNYCIDTSKIKLQHHICAGI